MATCPFNDWVSAYQDGELDAVRRDQFQSHLPGCAPCNAELAELASLSGWFAAAPMPHLSQFSMHRLHNAVNMVMEEQLLGLARKVSYAAAVILLVSSVWLSRTSSSVTPTDGNSATPAVIAGPWAGVTEASDDSAPLTPAADYYLAQSSQQNDE